MTIKQTQRAGRLQNEGCLEYGEDDSRSTTRSRYKRPLACQEVSRYNQRNSDTLRKSLVRSNRLCGRKILGNKNHKKQSLQSISNYICMGNKDDCIPSYILAFKQKECTVRQGSARN